MVTIQLQPFLLYINSALKNSYRTGIWLSNIIIGHISKLNTFDLSLVSFGIEIYQSIIGNNHKSSPNLKLRLMRYTLTAKKNLLEDLNMHTPVGKWPKRTVTSSAGSMTCTYLGGFGGNGSGGFGIRFSIFSL